MFDVLVQLVLGLSGAQDQNLVHRSQVFDYLFVIVLQNFVPMGLDAVLRPAAAVRVRSHFGKDFLFASKLFAFQGY
jgi:hypothetical protein